MLIACLGVVLTHTTFNDKNENNKNTFTVQLPGRFYKPCVLQGFLILFTEEKLKTRMDFTCVPREPRTSPAQSLLGVAGIFHEALQDPRSILFNPT